MSLNKKSFIIFRINYLILSKLILISLVIVSLSLGCKKDKPKVLELPPATTSGNNTFGCKIDGEVFVPNGNFYYRAINQPAYFIEDGILGITVRNIYDLENYTEVHLFFKEGIFEPIIFENFAFTEILGVTETVESIENGTKVMFDRQYIADTTMYRKIEITRLDVSKGIVSGLFEFTGFDPKTEKRISVTEGRFDLKDMDIQ
jgi:hypothetical protein